MDTETLFCLLDMTELKLEPKRKTRPVDGITAEEKLAAVLE